MKEAVAGIAAAEVGHANVQEANGLSSDVSISVLCLIMTWPVFWTCEAPLTCETCGIIVVGFMLHLLSNNHISVQVDRLAETKGKLRISSSGKI